jgi:hypothetical protein
MLARHRIAQLLQHGLLQPSYVPCEIIRDLRDLTRMRASLSQEALRISNRVQKVLEDANVKPKTGSAGARDPDLQVEGSHSSIYRLHPL